MNVETFSRAMRDVGIEPPAEVVADGALHREIRGDRHMAVFRQKRARGSHFRVVMGRGGKDQGQA